MERISLKAGLAKMASIAKADMKSYIPLETAAIFFQANLFLKRF